MTAASPHVPCRSLRPILAAAAAAWALGTPVRAQPLPDLQGRVELPPLLVEAQNGARIRWRLGEAPGFEVLSACHDDPTRRLVQILVRRRHELGLLIPERFLVQTTEPVTFILFPQDKAASLAQELTREMARIASSGGTAAGYRPLDHLRLTDVDGTMIFALLDEENFFLQPPSPLEFHGLPYGDSGAQPPNAYADIVLSTSFVQYLLGFRAPALPSWFVVGATALYSNERLHDGRAVFQPDPWISPAAADALLDHADAPRALLPLSQLLVFAPPSGRPEAYRALWAAEAELFVRWALAGRSPGGAARFWDFLAQSATEPASETLFESCFGLNYADARDALSDYLPQAVRRSLQAPTEGDASPPDVPLRDATPEEVHRIRGEWARMVLRLVRRDYPAMLPVYEDQAREVLQGAYDRGERDSRLLGSLGLLDLEMDRPAAARPILEEAAAAGVPRPFPLAELAWLRLIDALAKPAGAGRTLDEAQAQEILGPAEAALRLEPPLVTAYEIAAEVAARRDRPPTAEERRLLNAGAERFASDSALVAAAALWDARAGDREEARRLAALGAWEAGTPAGHRRIAQLEAVIP